MPFTEEELRAVLEDNSAEVPPATDLTGNAERRGRKIRRRRYAAGAVVATGALAAGVLALPGLADESGRATPVAASVSPTPQAIHVDTSVLAGSVDGRPDAATPLLLALRRKQLLAQVSAKGEPVLLPAAESTPSRMASFADVVVAGTVEGFTAGQAPMSRADPTNAKALTSMVMRMRVDKTVKGSAPGPEIYVRVGPGSAADLPKFQTAIPAGARLVAFLRPLPSPFGDGGDGTGHPAGTSLMDQDQSLVFEDGNAGGTRLVGGPYASKRLGKPWTDATSIDRLVTLLQTVKDDCAAFDERLAMLKAKLRDQMAASRSGVTRLLVQQRIRCAKMAGLRQLAPGVTPARTP